MITEEMRIFVAIELPAEIKSGLAAFMKKLQSPRLSCVKWVNPQSIHLTLKFLGDVSLNQINDINERLIGVARDSQHFRLMTAETGCFPDIKKARILWLGLSGETEKLLTLQSRVEDSMYSLGFPRETRTFTAHLTLARINDHGDPVQRKDFSAQMQEAVFEPNLSINVDDIFLIRSQLTRSGAIYTTLSSYRLGM